jgi:hypothetical protein
MKGHWEVTNAPAWYYALPTAQREAFERGEPIWVGDKCYQVCPDCGSGVRLNKPVFGSMHLCAPESERKR